MTYLASSAGALIVDRNAWTVRANQAWGPSDVWNSGQSWEYLTGYHGWVSRVYQSGESWEAAYNRVYTDRYNAGFAAGNALGLATNLPAGSGSTPDRITQSYTFTLGESTKGSFAVNKTGRWYCYCQVDVGGTVNNQFWVVRLLTAGSERMATEFKPNSGGTARGICFWEGDLSSGQTVAVSGQGGGDGASNKTAVLTAIFIPTPTYPH